MKRGIRWSLCRAAAFAILCIAARLDEDDYVRWLSKQLGISCTNDGIDLICKRDQETLDWTSRHVRSTFFYTQVEDRYAAPDGTVEIRAPGFLGRFMDAPW
jgi:hypothetical protein